MYIQRAHVALNGSCLCSWKSQICDLSDVFCFFQNWNKCSVMGSLCSCLSYWVPGLSSSAVRTLLISRELEKNICPYHEFSNLLKIKVLLFQSKRLSNWQPQYKPFVVKKSVTNHLGAGTRNSQMLNEARSRLDFYSQRVIKNFPRHTNKLIYFLRWQKSKDCLRKKTRADICCPHSQLIALERLNTVRDTKFKGSCLLGYSWNREIFWKRHQRWHQIWEPKRNATIELMYD